MIDQPFFQEKSISRSTPGSSNIEIGKSKDDRNEFFFIMKIFLSKPSTQQYHSNDEIFC